MTWEEFVNREEILITDKETLTKASMPLTYEIEESTMFWELLEEYTRHNANCLGMAGVQIGLPYTGFYLAIKHLGEFRFRNPQVKAVSSSTHIFPKEGCMSFPGIFMDTVRYDWIDVYDDINGLNRYEGLLGVCIQHEMEHLEGKLMHDAAFAAPTAKRNDPCPICLSQGKENPPKFKKCKDHY